MKISLEKSSCEFYIVQTACTGQKMGLLHKLPAKTEKALDQLTNEDPHLDAHFRIQLDSTNQGNVAKRYNI